MTLALSSRKVEPDFYHRLAGLLIGPDHPARGSELPLRFEVSVTEEGESLLSSFPSVWIGGTTVSKRARTVTLTLPRASQERIQQLLARLAPANELVRGALGLRIGDADLDGRLIGHQ